MALHIRDDELPGNPISRTFLGRDHGGVPVSFFIQATDALAAVDDVELQVSVRDPYRQLSRVFHLIGRAHAPGQLAAGR
jgi:hypothetical protein